MQPEKDPIQFTRLLTENRISNERHNRELAELHEGWRMREAELLAHIERLEASHAPLEPTQEMIMVGAEAVLQAPEDLAEAARYIYTHMVAAARQK